MEGRKRLIVVRLCVCFQNGFACWLFHTHNSYISLFKKKVNMFKKPQPLTMLMKSSSIQLTEEVGVPRSVCACMWFSHIFLYYDKAEKQKCMYDVILMKSCIIWNACFLKHLANTEKMVSTGDLLSSLRIQKRWRKVDFCPPLSIQLDFKVLELFFQTA